MPINAAPNASGLVHSLGTPSVSEQDVVDAGVHVSNVAAEFHVEIVNLTAHNTPHADQHPSPGEQRGENVQRLGFTFRKDVLRKA